MAQDRILVDAEEENSISRAMMVWINSCPDLPVAIVNFEQLAADAISMALSTIQGAAIVRRYILGGHQGEYQFKLIYRLKPGKSNDARLKADEALNKIGQWAEKNYPVLGDGMRVVRLETTARSSIYAVYENGDEDHQILLKMIYEVI